ncbi:MAG: YjjW family glycine radical enzyme activase [Erysipelotrichaceae bacterium]|nr:YjjW family glycine radical enzyme activase [Erysipelotrichaceae bacterium]MDY6034547.1 YjjW family glycine radical enzyme activase [Bulleidia sp.]
MQKIAPINKIIEFSNVDGPGNRTSIFVQKCPFKCLYCHNPETIHMCNHCGKCVETCPKTNEALEIVDGKVIWHKEHCIDCDTCIHVCPHLSSPKITMMNADDVIEKLKPLFPYIQGITVSGGECTNYPEFLTELFTKVHANNKTCFLDSNGAYLYESMPELMEVTDAVMLDVKAWNQSWHKKLTGISNENVLRNLEWLQQHNKLYEVRTVCMPNMHEDNMETVMGVSSHLQANIRYKLIKYRPFGVRKEGLDQLGNTITTDEEIKLLKSAAQKQGAKNVVIV